MTSQRYSVTEVLSARDIEMSLMSASLVSRLAHVCVNVCVFVCVCVCEREKLREQECVCMCVRAQLRDVSSNEKPLFEVMRTRVFNKDSIVICFELISGHHKELVRGQTDVQGLFVVCV